MSRRGLEEHLIAGQWSPPVSASSMVTSSQPCLPRRSESISLENLHVTVPNELPSPDGYVSERDNKTHCFETANIGPES